MARYIDANALIQEINQSKANNNHNNSIAPQTHNAEHKKFIKMVLEQPTADVVEVVRCKDCQWFSVHNKDGCYRPGLDHHAQMTPVYENDYCSYGTPKERGGEK